jgi:hypothetical protein
MLNKFSKALKVVLHPLGLGFFSRIHIIFICRKSVVKKRAFLEYAILSTLGETQTSAGWRDTINGFKAFYAKNENNLIYEIPNCTRLILPNFSAVVQRYFDYIKDEKVKRAFGINDNRLEWVIKIRIHEAYATPTCLLTGLLSEYENNWEEFISHYVSTAYMTEANTDRRTAIFSEELYFTFAWLLWGPSYELDYRHLWAGLFQISYGDENNSIPVIANGDSSVREQLKIKFDENQGRRYGALITADISLYEKKEYLKDVRDFTNPDNSYFYKKVEDNDLSFVAQLNDFSSYTNYKSKKYYCTAYVWLLFELVDEQSDEFCPERSVAFFEHANLADNYTYSFLVQRLIDKSLNYFDSIFSNSENSVRKYRFVCAFNNELEVQCLTRYREEAEKNTKYSEFIKNNIDLNSVRSPWMVFTDFDCFFEKSENLIFKEVSISDSASVSDLGQFYTDIYLDCFQNADERESLDNLLGYLKRAESAEQYRYHILLLKDANGKVLGGGVFDYFNEINSAVIEFIAIRNGMRSGGLGIKLYNRIVQTIGRDAQHCGNYRVSKIYCEADKPNDGEENDKRHLHFWNKNSFMRVELNYVQPALGIGKKPVDNLWLLVSDYDDRGEEIPATEVNKFIWCYMKYCMQIDNPEQNEQYSEMNAEINGKEKLKLHNILN